MEELEEFLGVSRPKLRALTKGSMGVLPGPAKGPLMETLRPLIVGIWGGLGIEVP